MVEGNSEKRITGYALIAGYLGFVLVLAGVITLLPLLLLFFYPEEAGQAGCFVVPGVCSILGGYLLAQILRGQKRGRLEKNQEMVIVSASWILVIAVTAVPLVMTGDYTVTQAVFETVSGLSTAGLSVVDTGSASHLILIHRTFLLFFGGVGLVLVMTTLLSEVYGMRLFSAEGHGDRLLPSLLESARLIMGIYSGYILAGTALYVICGMSLFDAFNHAVGALSTGGFSTRPESIGYYDSPLIEMITVVLMLLGSTGFFVHLLILRGKWRDVLHHGETVLTIFFIALFTPVLCVAVGGGVYRYAPGDFRMALFQVVSALTTTGFQTVDSFASWSPAAMLVMIVLMFVGGSAGSTAGGLKAFRMVVLFKQLTWKFKRDIWPGRLVFTEEINKYGKPETVTSRERDQVMAFTTVYLLLFLVGTFIFCIFGYSIQDSMFEFASALSTVGLSVGITGVDAHPLIHWTAAVGMLLGRLEVFPVFIGISRLIADGKRGILRKIRRDKDS